MVQAPQPLLINMSKYFIFCKMTNMSKYLIFGELAVPLSVAPTFGRNDCKDTPTGASDYV